MRSLDAWLNGGLVGTLSEGHDLWQFQYDPRWATGPKAFDLSPELTRTRALHEDGATNRPVQWYFDNLLPEEKLRDLVAVDAGLKGSDDSFALLEYLGAESAGSLVLTPHGQTPADDGGLRALSDAALCRRIRNLAREPLSKGAPKRMSLAGAQNKLAVVYRDGLLYEPIGNEPSTHILKPDHTSDDYPASVVNEYFTMSLAARLKLEVPKVYRRYTPEPVYIVERFDRHSASGATQRRHIIDACQLLNKARPFKTRAATLDTLGELIEACRNRAQTRLRLYRWLVFNVLIGNDDNHLKNLSFIVDDEGVSLSPHYDLLATSVYHTKAMAQDHAKWPDIPMLFALPAAPTFASVTRRAVVGAGQHLGLRPEACERELDQIAKALPTEMSTLSARIEQQNTQFDGDLGPHWAIEGRVLASIQHIVAHDMLERVR